MSKKEIRELRSYIRWLINEEMAGYDRIVNEYYEHHDLKIARLNGGFNTLEKFVINQQESINKLSIVISGIDQSVNKKKRMAVK